MNELVYLKRNDVFTDSFVMATGSKNEHRAVKQLIRTYESELSELGKVRISNVTLEIDSEDDSFDISNVEIKTNRVGRKNTYYELNEPQASFLMTLKKNNKAVVAFKNEMMKFIYLPKNRPVIANY